MTPPCRLSSPSWCFSSLQTHTFLFCVTWCLLLPWSLMSTAVSPSRPKRPDGETLQVCTVFLGAWHVARSLAGNRYSLVPLIDEMIYSDRTCCTFDSVDSAGPQNQSAAAPSANLSHCLQHLGVFLYYLLAAKCKKEPEPAYDLKRT